MTDEEIDAMLVDIHSAACDYDDHEYGLPMHDDETRVKMRQAVRRRLSSFRPRGSLNDVQGVR